MCSLESIWSEIISRTLVDIKLLDIHGYSNCSPENINLTNMFLIFIKYLLEFNSVPQTVPAKEGRHICYQPFLDQTITFKVRSSP